MSEHLTRHFDASQLARLLAVAVEGDPSGEQEVPAKPEPHPLERSGDEVGPFAPGRIVDDFEIVGEIGKGGMCFVYEAREQALKRTVALKVLRPSLAQIPSVAKRFRRETILSANLSHPNIVPIFSHGYDPETATPPYFTMEFVDGRSTEEAVETDGPLEAETAARLAIDLCEALHYAHENNIIHRDVTPRNILLQSDGRARVVDFGIAQDTTGQLAAATQTRGVSFGTVAFMSPEQNLGQDLDRRTDVFSLGMTLYFMLTGRLAYKAQNRAERALAMQSQNAQPPSARSPAADQALDPIVLKMIAIDRDQRYQTCREVADDLRAYLAGGEVAAAMPPARTAAATVFRVAIALLVIAVAGLGIFVWGRQSGPGGGAETAAPVGQPPADEVKKLTDRLVVEEGRRIIERFIPPKDPSQRTPDGQFVRDVHLAALQRAPTKPELKLYADYLAKGGQAARDQVLLMVLGSPEFRKQMNELAQKMLKELAPRPARGK